MTRSVYRERASINQFALVPRTGRPQVRIDVPAVVGDFLNDLSTVDLIVELVQNELDAGSTKTSISFGEDALVCEGSGNGIDSDGWDRLEYVLGAGGEVPAKVDGIGAKNHGLRAAFLLGNTIIVQSAGHRIDLTATGDVNAPDKFYPAVWSRIRDVTAPARGTRVTIPYRAKTLQVTGGQGFPLRVPTSDDLQHLFTEAVQEAPSRFVAASTPAKRWRYELTLKFQAARLVSFVFECQPLRGRRKGLFRRTCVLKETGKRSRLVESRLGATFVLVLAEDDKAKVPRIFRHGNGIVGEINWSVDRNDNPVPSTGALGYPIAYSTEYVRSGHGFNISGPFISGRARHSISEDPRNHRIIERARGAFADLTHRHFVRLFGVHTLELICSDRFPDLDAENVLIDKMLGHGAFPTAKISFGRKGTVVETAISDSSDSPHITIASPTYDVTVIAPSLVQLAGQKSLLHPEANSSVVAALLRAKDAGDDRVSWFTERNAALGVLVEDAATRGTKEWIEHATLALELLEVAKHQRPLPATLTHRLQTEGWLPTEKAAPARWREVRRSDRPIPEVPGVSPPAILHPRLTKLPLLRDGTLRVPTFNLDEYVSNRDFGRVIANGRQLFFDWLRRSHAALKPSTLSMISKYPIWPGQDDLHRPLNYYCVPGSSWLGKLLAEVLIQPADTVSSFRGLRKRGNGPFMLRRRPTLEELQAWRNQRAEAVDKFILEEKQEEAITALKVLEADMNQLRTAVEYGIDEIAPDHRTFSRVGELVGVDELHIPTPSVEQCGLLDVDVISGEFNDLYLELGAVDTPSAPALLRALKKDPDQDRLFSRLHHYQSTGRSLSELKHEAIIFVGGRVRPPSQLTLPGSVDWWGQWKTALDKVPDIPERVSLLEKAGVIHQSISEELSIEFFQWLATSSIPTQRKHLQQILRHWRDRRRGPRKWIENYTQLPCIPVRGHGDVFALVSLQTATGLQSRIFLPDFPELQEQLLADQKAVRLVITAAKSVSDSVMDVMRDAGLLSLRNHAGRAIRVATASSLLTNTGLDEMLARIQAGETLRGLTQRLPHFEVPVADLRHEWRQHLLALKGVRLSRDLKAIFSILRQEYAVAVDSAVDTSTGLLCIDDRVDPKLAFYDALASHLFREGSSTLWAYGLLRAVESRYEPILFDFRNDSVEPEEIDEPIDGSRSAPTEPARVAHGLPATRSNLVVPNPTKLADISNPTTLSGKKQRHPKRSMSSTDEIRHTIEEEEQKRELKEQHYAWHCQACLGEYEVITAAPPGSYVYLPSFRQGLIEAHHVTHLQNNGAIGGKNLIVVCKFHHDYIGDRLSGTIIRNALSSAKPAIRRFPTNPDGTRTTRRDGLIAEVELDALPRPLRLYFTQEHSAAWLS